MPWLLIFLTGGMIGAIVRWVIFGLGFGVVVFLGMEALLSWVWSQVQDEVTGAPAAVVGLLGLARIDVAFSIIFAAYGVNLARMVLSRLARLG
jgi:hypothetical protein